MNWQICQGQATFGGGIGQTPCLFIDGFNGCRVISPWPACRGPASFQVIRGEDMVGVLFHARCIGNGIVEYTSRRTGRTYLIGPDDNTGRVSVRSGSDFFIHTMSQEREAALSLVEMADKGLANLPKEGGLSGDG